MNTIQLHDSALADYGPVSAADANAAGEPATDAAVAQDAADKPQEPALCDAAVDVQPPTAWPNDEKDAFIDSPKPDLAEALVVKVPLFDWGRMLRQISTSLTRMVRTMATAFRAPAFRSNAFDVLARNQEDNRKVDLKVEQRRKLADLEPLRFAVSEFTTQRLVGDVVVKQTVRIEETTSASITGEGKFVSELSEKTLKVAEQR